VFSSRMLRERRATLNLVAVSAVGGLEAVYRVPWLQGHGRGHNLAVGPH
jgi:hypothetical protein